MVALFCLFLTLSVSPFKSKSRLEAENAAAPSSTDCAAAQGARSRPAHKWGSFVLGPTVSMVSIGAQGHHYHPTGDPWCVGIGPAFAITGVGNPAPLEAGPKSTRTYAH